MLCARVIVFFLVVLSTGAAVASIFLPLLRQKEKGNTLSVYYWFSMTRTPKVDGYFAATVSVSWDWTCGTLKNFYIVASCLNAGGSVVGLIASYAAFGHLYIKRKCCCCCFLLFLQLVCACCMIVAMAFVVSSYTSSLCNNDEVSVTSFKTQGYNLVEGFALLCISCGGFVLSIVFELFS